MSKQRMATGSLFSFRYSVAVKNTRVFSSNVRMSAQAKWCRSRDPNDPNESRTRSQWFDFKYSASFHVVFRLCECRNRPHFAASSLPRKKGLRPFHRR